MPAAMSLPFIYFWNSKDPRSVAILGFSMAFISFSMGFIGLYMWQTLSDGQAIGIFLATIGLLSGIFWLIITIYKLHKIT